MALSNTAVPKYYGMFRDAVLRGEIRVNRYVSMQMNLIDKLIADLGAVVVTEDAICDLTGKTHVDVLNQWTYHARMYQAAKYVSECGRDNVNLVQLVSFGCGLDAITTDEVRSILKQNNKIYTQIKIDEITNLGAVKIRLRSLFAAIERGSGHV